MPAPRCDKCRKPIKGKVYKSPMMRPLCSSCWTRLNGQAAGYMSGGYTGAVAGPGILSWVRKSLGRDDADGE